MPKVTVAISLDGGVEVAVLGIDPKDILIIGLDHYEYEESKGELGIDALSVGDLKDWGTGEGGFLHLANEKGLLPDDVRTELGL